MSEEKPKKTKIDLKARLGKKDIAGGGAPGAGVPAPAASLGSTPPPSSGGGAPAAVPAPVIKPTGIAPPPGISPGIPLPPFATAAKPAPAREPKQTAQAQTIKVEVGEEVEAERSKYRKFIALSALLGIGLGAGVAFPISAQRERSDRGKLAVVGAAQLEKDVKGANDVLKQLTDKLQAAIDDFGSQKYPTDFGKELASLVVPFDALTLENKRVGDLPAKTQKLLFQYLIAVEDLNNTRERLQSQIGFAKDAIPTFWKESKEPVVAYSIVLKQEGQKGFLAQLVPNKDPFVYAKDWPASYEVKIIERSQQGAKENVKKGSRYTKGDLIQQEPQIFPVDPNTTMALRGEAAVGALAKSLREMKLQLEGNNDDPQNPKIGVAKLGEDLVRELHQNSLAGAK